MTVSETVGSDEGLASLPINPSSPMTPSSPMNPCSPMIPCSPKNRLKFLCSYGGKILPRSSDGKLKYVGGETRMVAVPGDIKFSELKKKVNGMVEGDVILKFPVIPEELDALVTVKSDEDVKHMVDEYHRLESEGTPKLRVFLFPSNPIVVENQTNPADPYAIEQRYIEAINGIPRPSSNNTSGRQTPVNPNRSNFSISACTSPRAASPDAMASSYPMEPSVLSSNQHNKPPMPKVRSSPSLYNLHLQSNNNHSNHQVYQQHHHYQQNHQQPQPYGIQSPRTSPDWPHDFTRGTMGHGHVPVNRVYPVGRHNMGNGYHGCPCCCDDCMAYPSGGSSRRGSPSTSGRLDKPDSPSHRNHMPE
ncbi:UDP-glycosyltransferase 76C2-like [Hibiscus syriacus]|uniref:UDP-glycosyltransferase 76C2-like n=1 Tax=Hibiscus syriacus TaxID=106335 RepID=A0A6A3BWA0_HIBSY|nr:uncharacterized protein LOC120211448 [Hibiscus syriacus]XP_039065910.1 uncharacterized protein LOC120211448 [Hibiscus syriacus]KAE8719189.1 UDP-glycosyltransferase 76C2-like [Hibiscus syriacus]